MAGTVFLGPDPWFSRTFGVARRAPATLVVLAACIALFAIAERHGSTEDVATLVRFGAAERGHVWAGEVWRFVTAAFLHIGVLHLVWNVVAMFGWCVPVERALGSVRFLVVYLGAAVAGSAVSLLAWDVVSAGASGAGFGVIGAALVLDRRRLGSWRAFASDPGVRRTLGTAAFWTLVLAGIAVDHAAHLGGLVGGVVLATALTVPEGASRTYRRRAAAVAVGVVLVPAALALVPRSGITEFAAYALQAEIGDALNRSDLDAADRLLARAAEAGVRSTYVEYSRAFVLELRGNYDGAARGYEALGRSLDPGAARQGTLAAKTLLAWRLATGAGMPADPVRAREVSKEACSAGNTSVCRWLEQNPQDAGDSKPAPATAATAAGR